MCSRIWMIVVVTFALIVAILAAVWPQERLLDIIYIARFFDVMLPVLAVGALVQYLSGIGIRLWSLLIVAIALLVAVVASLWPQERLNELLLVTRFFDVALPILAVGALVKFLGLTSGLWSGLILLVALIVAILAVTLPQDYLIDVVHTTRFFDVMLPILAVGALVKYLCTRNCAAKTGLK